MTSKVLLERIAKAEAKIVKKQGTIERYIKQIAKKSIKFEELCGDKYIKGLDSCNYRVGGRNQNSDAYWLLSELDTAEQGIENAMKVISDTLIIIDKYKEQLDKAREKENIYELEIPKTLKVLESQLVEQWNKWDLRRKESLLDDYNKMKFEDFIAMHGYGAYSFMTTHEDNIIKDNEKSAKVLVIDLYNRVKAITGDIIGWESVEARKGSNGLVLNGTVFGKDGNARIETIMAGGYNIQRLHLRVLVKSGK